MVNTFNSEFAIHIAHMKAETKATCVPTFHLSNSSVLWGQSLQHKRIWSNICRHEITSVVQRRVWLVFFKEMYLFEWGKKRAPKILSNEMFERNWVYVRSVLNTQIFSQCYKTTFSSSEQFHLSKLVLRMPSESLHIICLLYLNCLFEIPEGILFTGLQLSKNTTGYEAGRGHTAGSQGNKFTLRMCAMAIVISSACSLL